MNDEHTDPLEPHIRFVAKHYREDTFEAEKAWKQFAYRHSLSLHTTARQSSCCSEAGGPSSGQRSFHAGIFLRRYGAVAAVACLLVGLALFYRSYRNQPDWVAVAAPAGRTAEVYLPDSTLVSLAGNSRLRYDRKKYGKEQRAVQMNGKAFFQVKRDPARPFTVYTPRTETTVLGTRFQVEEDSARTDVAVYTGKVRFAARTSPQQVILTKGMSACYSDQQQAIEVAPRTDPNTFAWKTRELRFDNTPIADVMRALEDYYQVRLRNRTPRSGIKLSATFKDLPLDEVLAVINQTLDIRLVAVPAQ